MEEPPRLTIAARFCGPAGSGNGGYTAGLLAGYVGSQDVGVDLGRPVRVTLRRPPPLDIALEIRTAGGVTYLGHGETLIAEAEPGDLLADPPSPVSVEAARRAEASYAGRAHHPFPSCFVCGTGRLSGDGLLLAPGPIRPGETGCVWRPDRSLRGRNADGANATASTDGPDGTNVTASPDGANWPADEEREKAALSSGDCVAAEFVWSALDCPGGWTSDLDARPLVLGRMTATCDALPRIGEDYVVVGRLLDIQRRKTYTAAALYDVDGQLLARAEHIWIAVDPATFSTS